MSFVTDLPHPLEVATVDLVRALEGSLAQRAPIDIADGGRRAAVMLVLYDRAGQAHLLLTKRAAGLSSHPGQVSLPGGSHEPGDPDLMTTALRETHEEVGIPPAALRVIGRLDDVNTRVSGFLVRPFVAYAEDAPAPVPADAEVARVMEVPVGAILAIDAVLPEAAGIATLRYPLDGEDVWGATARILRTFAALSRDALDASASSERA